VIRLTVEAETASEFQGKVRDVLVFLSAPVLPPMPAAPAESFDVPAVPLAEAVAEPVAEEKPRKTRAKKAESAVVTAPAETFEKFPEPSVATRSREEIQAAFSAFAAKSVEKARALLDEFVPGARFKDLTPEQLPAFDARLEAVSA
jgi:hypothetical protein